MHRDGLQRQGWTTRWETGTVRMNPAVLLAVACGASVLAACASSTPAARGPLQSTSTARSTTTTSAAPGATDVPPCTARELRPLGGSRQGGGFQTAAAVVELENVGREACLLDQAPSALSLVGAPGTALDMTYQPGPARRARPLRPGAEADVQLSWANWCRGDPGPLRVRLTLAAGGTLEAPFDGPPDYVPGCTAPGQPSTVLFLGWLVLPSG